MRDKLNRIIALAAIGLVALIALFTVAIITSSWFWAVVAGVLGVLTVVFSSVSGARVLHRVLESNDRQSTQLNNQARRLEAQRADIDAVQEKATELTIAGESTNKVVSTLKDELGATITDLAEVRSSIEATELAIRNGDDRLTDQEDTSAEHLRRIEWHVKRLDRLSERQDRARRDIQNLRLRVPKGFLDPVDKDIKKLKFDAKATLRTSFEAALQLGRAPSDVLSPTQAKTLFRDYVANDSLLQLRPIIENFDLLEKQSLTTLRRIFRAYRSAGYWDVAADIVNVIHKKSELDNDAFALAKMNHEIEVFSRPELVAADLEDGNAYSPTGPILHMVGRVLPETQTGYTLRTQYTALAQAKKGLPVAIVGQVGITEQEVDEITKYEHQGIDYYLLPGPPRKEMLLDDWLRLNMEKLADLVREIRPSILHAQSDFFNALIVNVVGKKYGIPTVYESRGFWEESWLSRTIDAHQWKNADAFFGAYGTPLAYTLRKHSEETSRLLVDHVFTLADVMKDYILESAQGEIAPEDVTIVPNAVDAANFPVQLRDLELAAELGIPEDTLVIGYISSIVEYEGIDTLIDAFDIARRMTGKPTMLLLVGDGNYRANLEEHVANRDIENVLFTGRVPHEDVLRYYGLIDLFVVPRKKTTVADLVTPLKPFEAFSTGRAVILSDVGALKEIADQSGAVETFRAGDSADLARKLVDLIDDPERRAELSSLAARWVRNHRSWDGNVNDYYRVYRSLGYEGPTNLLVESELGLQRRGINPGEAVEALSEAHQLALRGWFTIQDDLQSAESVMRDGWKHENFDPVKVTEIHDWSSVSKQHRSWGFHLHAWEFMDPILLAYDETGERKWIDTAIEIAIRWIETHQRADESNDPMVWYDMAQALRMPRLIAITLRAARLKDARDSAVILAEAIGWHFDELEKDRAFNPNNNHGFYTAVSQVHASKYAPMFPESKPTAIQGRERLARMASSQFAEDGTHLEHSPDYHRMLLSSFELAVRDDLIEDEEVKVRIRRAANVLGWMVQPDGALVQFGDSPQTRVVREDAKSIDPETEYILTDGACGTRPRKELAVLADGGYAFVRSPQPDGVGKLHESGYLAFSAAFHSRAHKHADDLNVVWFDRGQQILTDAGRFGYGDLLPADSPLRSKGYYYATPERQYVESTMAHNTLMMDGKDQERRKRQPYGSALTECQESDGIFDLSGRVHHTDYIHRRRVVYRPGEELRLMDSIFSQSPDPRTATLWLNIAGQFELESINGRLVFGSDGDNGPTKLEITGPGKMIRPVRGQRGPLRGWRSRFDGSVEPVWSIGFEFEVETRASVETRLRLS